MTDRTDPSNDSAEIAERLRDVAAWLRFAADRVDVGDPAEARRMLRVASFGLTGREAQIAALQRVHPDCVCPPDDTLAVCRFHAEGCGRGD